MTSLRTFAKLTSIYVVGEVLILAGGLISFPIFTRILDRDEYGLMTLVTSAVAFAEIAATLGLRHAAIRLYYAYDSRGEADDFVATTIWGSVAFGVVGAVVLAAGGWALSAAGWIPARAALLLAVASGLVVVRVTTKIFGSFYRLKGRVKSLTLLSILVKYVGMVLAILLVAWLRLGVTGFFAGLLAGEAAVLVAVVVFAGLSFGFPRVQLRSGILREAVRYGLPLTFSSFGAYVLSNGDRFIVGHYLGAGSVALYSVPYNLCSYVSALILAAYEFAFVPMIMEQWERGRPEDARRLTGQVVGLYALVAFPTILGLSVVGDQVLSLLASEKYRSAAAILPWVVTGEMLRGLFTPVTIGLQFQRRTTSIAWVMWGSALLNLALNVVLVPRFGLYGAAVATVASYAALVMAGAAFAFRYFAFPIPWRAVATYGAASVVMAAAVRAASKLSDGGSLPLLVGVGVVTFGLAVLGLSGDARRGAHALLRTGMRRSA